MMPYVYIGVAFLLVVQSVSAEYQRRRALNWQERALAAERQLAEWHERAAELKRMGMR